MLLKELYYRMNLSIMKHVVCILAALSLSRGVFLYLCYDSLMMMLQEGKVGTDLHTLSPCFLRQSDLENEKHLTGHLAVSKQQTYRLKSILISFSSFNYI